MFLCRMRGRLFLNVTALGRFGDDRRRRNLHPHRLGYVDIMRWRHGRPDYFFRVRDRNRPGRMLWFQLCWNNRVLRL